MQEEIQRQNIMSEPSSDLEINWVLFQNDTVLKEKNCTNLR